MQISQDHLKEIEDDLLLTTHEVGQTLLDYSPQVKSPEYNGTDIDLILDQQIKKGLKSILDVPILSEESAADPLDKSNYLWVIDPLDGTMNALVGNPNVAISIALMDSYKMRTIVSIVSAPFHKMCFHARLGS